MNQIFHLFQLQKIDLQIDQSTERIREIDIALESSQTLKEAEHSLSSAKLTLEQIRKDLKKKEEEVVSCQIKIETSESNLYGGRIVNPKELKDIQTEIQSLKKRKVALEDLQLEEMAHLEDAETCLQVAEKHYAEIQADMIQKNAQLLGEKSRLSATLEKLKSERNIPYSAVSDEYRIIYENLRRQKRGIAIVSVKEGACSACGEELRPAEIQAAKSPSQVAYCSCGRIIYAG